MLATLKHAASMANPLFYERQRRRLSTWDTPRFLRSYDETLDDGLVMGEQVLRSQPSAADGSHVRRRQVLAERALRDASVGMKRAPPKGARRALPS